MILVDANLLIYAHVNSCPEHGVARDWLDRQINGTSTVGLPWPSLLAFLRIVTNPRVFEYPRTDGGSLGTGPWLALPVHSVWIPQPTERHAEVLDALLRRPGVHANLVPDVHLAALALEHGLTLCSTDGGFAPIQRLEVVKPLDLKRSRLPKSIGNGGQNLPRCVRSYATLI